ncbi:extracellular solute-binding protein [Paenibacillus chungangensis]|uniref:Extracellular solute-binding protein n=1 Tax=Paenibacillus chungangensis TaxID=696535 RepID=A0ABW3HSX3_9BACL
MTRRRLLAALMIAVLLIVTACSSQENSNNNASSPGSESGDGGSGEPSPPEKAYILTKVEAGTELSDDKAVLDEIRKETNVEPVMIKPPAGTYEEKLNIMLASNEPLDAFIVSDWTEFKKKGMIRPINDLLELAPELVSNYTQEEWDAVTDKETGNIYAIPFANTPIGNAPRIREDWLEELGLQMPTTLEQFEQVLEAFHFTDKFGDNVIPLVTHLSFQQLDRAFMGLWTEYGDHHWIDDAGNVKPAILHPGYKDYIAKLAEWYAKGYIWKEAFTQEINAINDLVAQDRVGVLATWVSVGMTGIDTLLGEKPEARYNYMRTFEGPAGSAYSLRLPVRQGIAFSVNSKNAEAAIKFFNWGVSNPTNRNIIDFGLEGKHWNWVDQNEGIIERVAGAEKQYSGMFSLVQGATTLGSTDRTTSGQLWAEFFNFTSDASIVLKKPADYGTIYDEAKINETVPSVSDIDKLRDRWLVKFITGQEPISKWDTLLAELNKLGLDRLVAERTRQYREQAE